MLGEVDNPRARAQHAAGNLDNRHVEIVCAASPRVNVSVFYQPLTPPTGLGLLLALLRGGLFSVGQRAARSLPERWPAVLPRRRFQRFKAIDSRTGEGQPGRCPFLIGGGNGRHDARPWLWPPPCRPSGNACIGNG